MPKVGAPVVKKDHDGIIRVVVSLKVDRSISRRSIFSRGIVLNKLSKKGGEHSSFPTLVAGRLGIGE